MQLARLNRFSILTLSVILSLVTNACGSTPHMEWHPKIYLGDEEAQSVVRKNGDQIEEILTSDPKFHGMVCMFPSELPAYKKAEIDLINKCEKWKDGSGQ